MICVMIILDKLLYNIRSVTGFSKLFLTKQKWQKTNITQDLVPKKLKALILYKIQEIQIFY